MPKIRDFLKIFLFLPFSWLVVHFFGAFGFFVALAYPILFLFFPKSTPCFLCYLRENKDNCAYCLPAGDGEHYYPASGWSVLMHTGVILLLSLVCVGVIFLEMRLLAYFNIPSQRPTVSFVIPPRGQYRLGEIFPMKIELANIKATVNVVQADLGFNPAKLEVVEITTKDSFASIFIQKEIDNRAGYARLTGGLPNPGYIGERGIFGTVYLKGKQSGLATVEFLPSSLVLANDGKGTNILKEFASVAYLILPERISKEEQKQQEQLVEGLLSSAETPQREQLRFYEEKRILGEQMIEEEAKPTEFMQVLANIQQFVLNLWWQINNLIFSFWLGPFFGSY